MSYLSASLIYRKASIQQASAAGLVIALYDTLAADLQQAIAAVDHNSIEARSNALKHAFRVLAHLNAQVNRADGGATAAHLLRFYEHLRRSILSAQFQPSSALLQSLIAQIFQVRAAWQQVDSRNEPAPTAMQTSLSAAQTQDIPLETSFRCIA